MADCIGDTCMSAWIVELSWSRNVWEEICVFRDKTAAISSCQDMTQHISRVYGQTHPDPIRVREVQLRNDAVL